MNREPAIVRLGAWIVGVIAAVLFLGVAGCDAPRVMNPYNPEGPKVTSEELVAARLRHEETLERQAKETVLEAKEKADTEQVGYDLALIDLEQEYQSRVRTLQAQHKITALEAESRAQRAALIFASSLSQSRSKFDDANAAIEREWEKREGALAFLGSPAVAGIAGMFPAGGVALSAVTGLAGLLAGTGRRRKAVEGAVARTIEAKDAEFKAHVDAWNEAETKAKEGGTVASLMQILAAMQPPKPASP